MLVWRTAPLLDPLTVTGEAELALTLSASYDEPAIFAYLELVDARGEIYYVTEAILRSTASAGQTTRLALRFLPTSVRVPAGWRLQIGLAATDADTFPIPLPADARWTVAIGGEDPATLSLPVRRGVALSAPTAPRGWRSRASRGRP